MNRWAWILLAGASASFAAGCSQSDSAADFKSFKDMPKPDVVIKSDDVPAEQVTAKETTATNTAMMDAPDLEAPTPVSALAPVNVVDGTSLADVLKVFPGSAGTTTPAEIAKTDTVAGPVVIAEPKPGGIQILVPHRDFKIEGPQSAIRVSYDDLDLLKVLNMEPVPEDALKHFPSWLKALDGQRIRLRGFMYPTFQDSGIDQFVLARDNQICCFGRNPKVYDLVSVQMRDGVTTTYIQNRPFDVVGIFRIDLIAEGGKPMGLYWLEDSIVINK